MCIVIVFLISEAVLVNECNLAIALYISFTAIECPPLDPITNGSLVEYSYCYEMISDPDTD